MCQRVRQRKQRSYQSEGGRGEGIVVREGTFVGNEGV